MSTFHSFEMSATHEHFCHDNFVDNAFVTSLFLLSGLRSAQIDHRVERKRIMPWKSCICPLHPVSRLFFVSVGVVSTFSRLHPDFSRLSKTNLLIP